MNRSKMQNIVNTNPTKLKIELISFERLKPLHICLLFIIFISSFSSETFGQEIPKDAEPPPIKVISKEEREQLSKETKIKNRTKLSLELMETRLLKAEELGSKNQYKEMFIELGRFHALVDNALWFLNRNDTDSGKVLNNFKRLEIGLRAFIPRLELIRRELPLNFEYYVRNLIINVRDARSKAVEPQFGDTVLPGNARGN